MGFLAFQPFAPPSVAGTVGRSIGRDAHDVAPRQRVRFVLDTLRVYLFAHTTNRTS
jgi:hypothetical protein